MKLKEWWSVGQDHRKKKKEKVDIIKEERIEIIEERGKNRNYKRIKMDKIEIKKKKKKKKKKEKNEKKKKKKKKRRRRDLESQL